MFHGTLKYESQLLDELPMVYGTAILDFCLLMTDSDRYASVLSIAMLIYSFVVTYLYVTIGDPLIHQIGYSLLVVITVFSPIYHLRKLKGEGFDTARLKKIYYAGIVAYFGGFAFWQVDIFQCEFLRATRSLTYPTFLRPFLEFHSYW